ncbi:MAG: ATP-binding protein [Lachnospiraceae bacterium]|nr:ATP-binding protein [Lachnospiraceae bacterium]
MIPKNVKRVVITGGPCAGKTTAIENIRTYFEEKKSRVIFVNEVPTEIMKMGITLAKYGKLPFQKAIIDLQRKKEQVIMDAACSVEGEQEVLIIYDRGILDHFIYLNDKEQKLIEEEMGIDRQQLYGNYDLIIHMLSVASKMPELYENSEFRLEAVPEAKEIDNKIGNIWKQHSNYIQIDCERNFEDKIQKLINIISSKTL